MSSHDSEIVSSFSTSGKGCNLQGLRLPPFLFLAYDKGRPKSKETEVLLTPLEIELVGDFPLKLSSEDVEFPSQMS